MTYKCIKAFSVPECDGDGFETGEQKVIEFGTIWELDNDSNIIGGEIHLDGLDSKDLSWLEITNEDLAEKFELLGGDTQ